MLIEWLEIFLLCFFPPGPPPKKKNLPKKDFEFHRIFVDREIYHKMDYELLKNVICMFEKIFPLSCRI
jgi:hypothetical protein